MMLPISDYSSSTCAKKYWEYSAIVLMSKSKYISTIVEHPICSIEYLVNIFVIFFTLSVLFKYQINNKKTDIYIMSTSQKKIRLIIRGVNLSLRFLKIKNRIRHNVSEAVLI